MKYFLAKKVKSKFFVVKRGSGGVPREYAKISITYGVTVPYISMKFDEKSKKYKKSDAENNYEIVNNPPKIEKAGVTG